jgi:uncharacterized protein (TIGR03067 family)
LKPIRSSWPGGAGVIDSFPKTAAFPSEELQAMFLDRLKVLVLSVAVVFAFGAGQARADEKDKPTDEKKILGTWTIESFMEGGKKADKELIKDAKVTITADGKIKLTRGEQEEEFTYTLDSTQKPKEINLTNSKDKTASGIYKLEGDKLTVCFARQGGDRPLDFASEKGSAVVLQVLKREKK